jgi:hypothetical protein
MRRTKLWIAVVLPLVLAAGACSRKEPARVVAPEPRVEGSPAIAEAHWVWDKDALAVAVNRAAASPLVQRALSEAPKSALSYLPQYAVHVAGTTTDGSRASATVLPYMDSPDSTRAMFVSVLEQDGVQLAEQAELILGRDPLPIETGFVPTVIGTTPVWVKSGPTYALAAGGFVLGSPGRISKKKFLECFAALGQEFCDRGADLGRAIAPEFPAAAAIGCNIGTATAAITCVAVALRR